MVEKSKKYANDDWNKLDPAERLQAVHEFASSGANDSKLFISAALNDLDDDVRCAAINYLGDLQTLEILLQQEGTVGDAASLQYHKLLSGSFPSELTEQDRIRVINSLGLKSRKQVALLAKCKVAGSAALSLIGDNEDLADLCMFAASVFVRKAAAEKIEDIDLIKELIGKLAGKDKTVFKVLSSKVSSTESKDNAKEKAQKVEKVEQPEKGKKAQVEPLEKTDPTEPITTETLEGEVGKINTALSALSHKNSSQIAQVTSNLRKLQQQVNRSDPESVTPAVQQLQDLGKALAVVSEKNNHYQGQLFDSTNSLIEQLAKALEDGKSDETNQLWNKIQSNIDNTSGKISRDLKEKTSELRSKVKELRDWKIFAATQKKKELISQMQHLLESKMHPPDKAKHINKLHNQWKALGRSSENEKLWRKFKNVSDKAYEPCKEFFKQHRATMASNLKQRNEICAQLGTFLETIDSSAVNIVSVNKVEARARDEWKLYAPVEHSRIKKLQKHFYGLMDQLRLIKRTAMQENAARKHSLVAQAEELTSMEDNKEAMNKAKSLQAEWKLAGPSSYKDDRKSWEAFRAACDKVFSKRDGERQEARAKVESALKDLHKIIDSLDELLKKGDEEFRDSRKSYVTLQREFHNLLNPAIRKDRKRLLDRFERIVNSVEVRYRKLPDKKTLQARTVLDSKAQYCLNLESIMAACEDDEALTKLMDESDKSAWNSLGSCGNSQLDKKMDDRLQRLTKVRKVKQYEALLLTQENEVRNKVIELEIKADLKSPDQDKELRMQIQLNQLKIILAGSLTGKRIVNTRGNLN